MDSPMSRDILELARVPEHSSTFMRVVSEGEPFLEGDYLCLAADDWLMLVGYPLYGAYTHQGFETALAKALTRTGATDCWAIGPDMPARLHACIQERDVFYTLPATGVTPPRLYGPLRKAATLLCVEESTIFTAEHRRLWAEFMARVPLKPQVRELFARTPAALAANTPGLSLLNAWDTEGHLAATLLLDYAPKEFCSYILGAHSRSYYTPHAADLLFATLLKHAHREGKRYIHLGLGVNEGITRFKRKWGGTPALPYVMAAWREEPRASSNLKDDAREILLSMIGHTRARHHDGTVGGRTLEGLSKRQIWALLPEQRPFAMLWELEKNGKTSWIGGSAHFFCYSFENSFRKLFNKVDTVIFEGPLDAASLAAVEETGHTCTDAQRPLFDRLTKEEINVLSRVVRGPEGFYPRLLRMEAARKVDVAWYLKNTRPWCSLFTLWTAFLERHDWRQSVDLEAWFLAQEMGKTVIGMESLEEQIASLDSVLPERVVRYFRNCHLWKGMVSRNVRFYLDGDLHRLMGTSAEFPTRTERIIGHRDERFRQRMRPFIEAGRCAVFVGSAHMLNLRDMLVEDGFNVRQCLPTWRHRLRARWRKRG